jgi:hypothetical protein
MTADVPRLDYLGSSCPSLLLEPQRTNLVTFSEQFDNAAYVKADVTISANSTDSPDGMQSADKIIENTVNDAHAVLVSVPLASGTHTYSFFAKASGRSLINVQRNNSFITAFSHDYNLAAGTASGGGKIEPYANGFFRCSGVFEVTTASTTGVGIYLNNGSGLVYTGDGTSGVFAWGWQYEVGAYPTSYIPTLGTSVTRVADAASKTGISDLIGQTQGTLYAEFVWGGIPNTLSDSALFSIGFQEYGTSNIVISSYAGSLYARVTNGISIDATITFGAMTNGTRYKAALAYANNDVVFYVNGVNYGADTSVSIPTLSDTYLQNSFNNAKGINQALLFKTRLSNTELAQLTTL